MKIEEGKFYRTRDGQKAQVWSNESDLYPWVMRLPSGVKHTVTRNGLYFHDRLAEHPLDIVAEWHEDSLDRIEAEIKAELASPVRTVTRKEIVPGSYGAVSVVKFLLPGRADEAGVAICTESGLHKRMNAAELRAAAATLIEIADALDAESSP